MPLTVNIYDYNEFKQAAEKKLQITFCPFLVSRDTNLALDCVSSLNACMEVNNHAAQVY